MDRIFYPVFLDTAHFNFLVVGAGRVAERKAESLAALGAAVTVVAPIASPLVTRLARRRALVWKPEPYRRAHLRGMQLVIGSTDNRQVNEAVYRDCLRAGIPVNIVDDPPHCSFFMPGVFRRGPLCVAVSTSGVAPALAGKFRREMEASFTAAHLALLAEVGILRPRVNRLPLEIRRQFWEMVQRAPLACYRSQPDLVRTHLRALYTRLTKTSPARPGHPRTKA